MKLHFLTNLSLIKQIAQLRDISLSKIDDVVLMVDAKKNKEKLKRQWEKYQETIENNIKNIVRNEWVDNLDVKIFVFPDYIQVGACNCEELKILFGCKEEYPGFGLITICHEIIHMLIYKYRKDRKVSRLTDEVFVFLSAECELRKRLLNKDYFSGFFSGQLSPFHKDALQISKKLVENWNSYLLNKTISCKSFLDFIEKNISINMKEGYDNIKLTDFIGGKR